MAQYLTLVLEYKNNDSPLEIRANMEIFGGKLIAAIFNDATQEIDMLEQEITELERQLRKLQDQ